MYKRKNTKNNTKKESYENHIRNKFKEVPRFKSMSSDNIVNYQEKRHGDSLKILSAIEDIVYKQTVSYGNILYTKFKNMKKIEDGQIAMSIVFINKVNDKEKSIIFILDEDQKSDLTHLVIMNGQIENPHILFVASERNLMPKVYQYVPRIINGCVEIIR